MYNNKTYQELKDYYGKTTIFNVLGIERNENRHSSFLRWLLDNRSSHGLGDEPMKKFLRLYALHMLQNENPALNIMLMAGNYDLEISEIDTEKPVKKSKGDNGRIDIWARITITNKEEGNTVSLVIILENKIYITFPNPCGPGTLRGEALNQINLPEYLDLCFYAFFQMTQGQVFFYARRTKTWVHPKL